MIDFSRRRRSKRQTINHINTIKVSIKKKTKDEEVKRNSPTKSKQHYEYDDNATIDDEYNGSDHECGDDDGTHDDAVPSTTLVDGTIVIDGAILVGRALSRT